VALPLPLAALAGCAQLVGHRYSPGGAVALAVTWLFLFDRLIPLYQIRDEHYSIKRVFRRATPSEKKAGPRAPGEPPYQAQYLGWKFFVWPLDDPQLRHVEIS
jgi:hypothetical protein